VHEAEVQHRTVHESEVQHWAAEVQRRAEMQAIAELLQRVPA
jgi:hypothetical protein